MLKIAKVLEIPVVVTEQNPKGLGNTIPDIDLPSLGPLLLATIEKGLFSMVTPEVKALLYERPQVKSVVLFGIESHVCVLQSALDFIEAGYNVHVIADGVSSSNKEEIPFALARIRQSGGYITTSESAAFQLQRDAGVPGFKSFSNIIKEEKDNTVRTLQKLLQHRAVL
ncbi:Isochorismatase-like protein [Suillus bovinus]|uniref:Isochorismatase-like protein n=1 Tax=Suillus bovinus TaxID=48563 RepID=UPI001B87898E|nr:Isochorismatase-like protein [Suillus bovinus]KAG2159044.1 Isochorismatase-like protein [Suillus bovinus]